MLWFFTRAKTLRQWVWDNSLYPLNFFNFLSLYSSVKLPDASLPIFTRRSTADSFEFTWSIPRSSNFDASSPTAGAEAAFVKFCIGAFTSDGKYGHVDCLGPWRRVRCAGIVTIVSVFRQRADIRVLEIPILQNQPDYSNTLCNTAKTLHCKF